MLTLSDLNPQRFHSIKSLDAKEELYYKVFDEEKLMTDYLQDNLKNPSDMYMYFLDLIHQGRSRCSTYINSVTNLKYYEGRGRVNATEEVIKSLRRDLKFYEIDVCVYLRSLLILFSFFSKKEI